jgi:predicted DNA-binding protein
MWSVQSEKMKQVKIKKERVNFVISKEYRERFKNLCHKNGLIMSVFVENAIKRFVDSR